MTPTRTPSPPPGCGNGQVNIGEQCDDGNEINGDGCSSGCRIEFDKLLPGGRNARSNCAHEWLTRHVGPGETATVSTRQLTCRDDDPNCDFGDQKNDRACTFYIAQCFNVTDERLRCSRSQVERVDILSPNVFQGSVNTANRTALETTLGVLGAEVRGICVNSGPQRHQPCQASPECDRVPGKGDGLCLSSVIFAPSLDREDICGAFAPIRVPLRENAAGLAYGTKLLKIRTRVRDAVTGKRLPSDIDLLSLTCLPPR